MQEILSERRRRRKVYDLGAGRRRVVCSMANLHVPRDFAAYLRGDPVAWDELDLSCTNEGGDLRLRRGWFGLEVPDGQVGYRYQSRLRQAAEVRVRLLQVGGVPVTSLTVPTPRVDGNEIWWDDVLPQLSFFLRVQTGKLEIYKRLEGPLAPREFVWELIETWPSEIPLRTETAGHDNADLAEPSRANTGPGRIRRNIRMQSQVLSENFPQPGIRRRLVRERWTGQTIALDANRFPSPSNDVVYPVLIDQDITESIADANDDGHEVNSSSWAAQYGSTGDHIIYDQVSGNEHFPGYRFQTVDVPQGATIDGASLKVTFAGNNNGTGAAATVYAQDADDAPAWGTTRPSNMAKTTGVSFGAWGSAAGSGQRTITVTDDVQTVVNRAGWVSGNDMAFGVTFTPANSQAWSYIHDLNGGASNIAVLEIDYTSEEDESSSSSSSSSSSVEFSSSSSSSSSSSVEFSSSSSSSSSSSVEFSSSSSSSSSSSVEFSSSSSSSSSSSQSDTSESSLSSSSSSDSSSSSSNSSSSSSESSSSSVAFSSSSSSSESSSSSSESSSSSSESSSSSSQSSSSSSESSSSSVEFSSSSSSSDSSSSSESSSESSQSSSSSSASSSSSSPSSSSSSSVSGSESSTSSSSVSDSPSSSSSSSVIKYGTGERIQLIIP